MRILSFHLFVLLGLGIISCSTPQIKTALKPLPAKWIAKSSMESACSALVELGEKKSFQICSGAKFSKAAGIIRFFDQAQLIEVIVASRDPLAISSSISADSAWAKSKNHLFVGTHDGRILKFNLQGEILGTHLLKMPTWVQHLQWSNDSLYALTSRHQSVTVLKLSHELLAMQNLELSNLESEAEWAMGVDSIYITTNTGHIYQTDLELKLQDQWSLGRERELGKPILVNNVLWVGDSEGVIYQISKDRIQHAPLGVGPVSSAPIITKLGLWIAFDEEGILRLVDQQFKIVRTIKLPITRSFTGFESHSYQGHTLMRTSTQGIVTLLSTQGEILISAEGEESQIEFAPEPRDNLAQERLPASGI